MVLPRSDRIARVPPYSRPSNHPLPVRGCHPLKRAFPDASGSMVKRHWPGPRSLATTNGVSVDFLSSGYLDVSVPRVCPYSPMYSGISTCLTLLMIATPRGTAASGQGPARSVALRSNNNRISGGFPHSDIHGSKPIPGSPWLNAGYHVLHRLLLPRHPPNALIALDPIQKTTGPFGVLVWPTALRAT